MYSYRKLFSLVTWQDVKYIALCVLSGLHFAQEVVRRPFSVSTSVRIFKESLKNIHWTGFGTTLTLQQQHNKTVPKPCWQMFFLKCLQMCSLMSKRFWCNNKGDSPSNLCVKCSWTLQIGLRPCQVASESTIAGWELKGCRNIGYQHVEITFHYK